MQLEVIGICDSPCENTPESTKSGFLGPVPGPAPGPVPGPVPGLVLGPVLGRVSGPVLGVWFWCFALLVHGQNRPGTCPGPGPGLDSGVGSTQAALDTCFLRYVGLPGQVDAPWAAQTGLTRINGHVGKMAARPIIAARAPGTALAQVGFNLRGQTLSSSVVVHCDQLRLGNRNFSVQLQFWQLRL